MNPLYLQLRDELDQVELTGRERDILVAVLNRSIRWGKPSVRLTRSELKALAGIHGKDEIRPIRDLERKRMLLVEDTDEGTRYTVDPNPRAWRASLLISDGDRRRLDQAIALSNGWEQQRLDFVAEEPSLSALMANAAVAAVDSSQSSNRSHIGGREQDREPTGRGQDWIAAMKQAASGGFVPQAVDSAIESLDNRAHELSSAASAELSAASADFVRPKIGQLQVAGHHHPENREVMPENRDGTRAESFPKIGHVQVPDYHDPENRAKMPENRARARPKIGHLESLDYQASAIGTAEAKALAKAEASDLKLKAKAKAGALLLEVQRECPQQWPAFRERWRKLIEVDPDYVEFSLLKRLRNERREGREIRNGAAWMSRIARDDGRYPKGFEPSTSMQP